jgi:hypothetical protein
LIVLRKTENATELGGRRCTIGAACIKWRQNDRLCNSGRAVERRRKQRYCNTPNNDRGGCKNPADHHLTFGGTRKRQAGAGSGATWKIIDLGADGPRHC